MTYIRSSLTHVLNLLNHIAALFFQLLFNDTECDNATKWSIKISASNTNTIDADIDIDSEKSSASKQKNPISFIAGAKKKITHCPKQIVAWKTSSIKIETRFKINFSVV